MCTGPDNNYSWYSFGQTSFNKYWRDKTLSMLTCTPISEISYVTRVLIKLVYIVKVSQPSSPFDGVEASLAESMAFFCLYRAPEEVLTVNAS